MKRIFDKEIVNKYVSKHNIYSFFQSKDLDFFIITYEKGEKIIEPFNSLEYFQFAVEGSISIYSINKDGSQFILATGGDSCTLLGDVEFINDSPSPFFAEADSNVTTICLYIAENKSKLQNDIIFLNYLLKSLANKLEFSAHRSTKSMTLEDKLLHYIEYNCANKTLDHVGKAALYLHCSRRQIQRLLKGLVDDNKLLHISKGTYMLVD